MEAALFAVVAIVFLGFAGLIYAAIYFGKRIYAEFVAFGANVQHNTSVIWNKTEDVLGFVEEIRDVLTEASRIKAIRETGQESKPREPVRRPVRLGVAARRAAAERASLEPQNHQDKVRSNDLAAMEGR